MSRDYRNLPWMRETMYSNDVDPSHGPQLQPGQKPRERTLEETEALMRGESEPRPARMRPEGLGDGRPNPAMMDNSPMQYRSAYSASNEIDIDERDYMGETDEYVPVKPVQRPAPPEQLVGRGQRDQAQPGASPRQSHPLGFDQPTNNAPSAPHEQAGVHVQPIRQAGLEPTRVLDIVPNVSYGSVMKASRLLELASITARPGQVALMQLIDSTTTYNVTPDEVERMAHEMIGWAKAARLVRI